SLTSLPFPTAQIFTRYMLTASICSRHTNTACHRGQKCVGIRVEKCISESEIFG
ncbi:Uncharacterized protein DAT39_001597, partial [Clarias magur]